MDCISRHRLREGGIALVPVKYGHQRVLLKALVWDVVLGCGSEVIARHKRSYNREEMIFARR